MWSRILDLDLDSKSWTGIYLVNSKLLYYKKFAEFKYKVLLNILPCGKLVSRWDRGISAKCKYCDEIENTKQ